MMINLNCISARGINLVAGIVLLISTLVLLVLGFTIIPVIGVLLSVPALALSIYFLFAPRDQSCRVPQERT